MSGRNGCLLFVAFVLAITSFSVGQGKPFVRFAPRIPTDPPSVYLPGRIVRSPRPPISRVRSDFRSSLRPRGRFSREGSRTLNGAPQRGGNPWRP